jgi:arylsulfatase A-like enzyme
LADSTSRSLTGNRPAPLSLLGLSAWCGIVSGLLEVATIVLRKQIFDSNRLYQMSRHFIWVIPTTNLAIFLALGFAGCLFGLAWPRRGYRLAARVLGALTLLPIFLVAFPQIYGIAWFLLTIGVAAWLVPLLELHRAAVHRLVRASFPLVAGLVLILAGSLWAGDWLKERQERKQPLPPPASPNVLLLVLDTVAADHLSLYGYERPTSPSLVALSERGIRFDDVLASSSWTLPSHASMFTGQWPHELSAGWRSPLDTTHPTLAEYLGKRGYATAGFVANTSYCALDSGLARGFTHYWDYYLPGLSPLKMACLVKRTSDGIQAVAEFLDDRLDFAWPRSAVERMMVRFNTDRKDAATVNRQFLDWLSARRPPDRPFFAFLNYFDAHGPYELPPRRIHRFGAKPSNARDRRLIENWRFIGEKGLSARERALVYDAYDDCVAALDEQLGRLFDELDRRGALQATWVIIASDHGESFGEHPGVFSHGTSLYQTELHVPLVIIPPGGPVPRKIVAETVSLRNLAATVVDLVGLTAGSPFPGESLAPYVTVASGAMKRGPGIREHALAEVVPHESLDPDHPGARKQDWPLAALVAAGWAYIRREGDVREELFHLRVDSEELHNLAADPSQRPRLELMRETLRILTAGPLTPNRFNP